MQSSPLVLTIKIAVLATIISVILGIGAAWLVHRMKRGQGLVDGLFTLPMVLPPTVVGFGLLLLLGKNGVLGSILNRLGWSVIFTWKAGVIAAVVVSFPLMYRTVRGAMEQQNPDLAAAGRTLGMSEWRIFWEIVLPDCIPGITAGTVLAFARALGEFGATILIAGNIPGKTQTMSIAIYSAVQAGKLHYHEAAVWALTLCGISFAGMIAVNLWNGYIIRRRRGMK